MPDRRSGDVARGCKRRMQIGRRRRRIGVSDRIRRPNQLSDRRRRIRPNPTELRAGPTTIFVAAANADRPRSGSDDGNRLRGK
jgi:hypothetical protein